MSKKQQYSFIKQCWDYPSEQESTINYQKINTSQFKQEYLNMMHRSQTFPKYDDQYSEFKNEYFNIFGVTYYAQQQYVQFCIRVIEESINSQVTILEVVWGKFKTNLEILNILGSSPLHKTESFKKGNYGNIFIGSVDNQNLYQGEFVVKCIYFSQFKQSNMAQIMAIKQYFILKIAAALKVGPMVKPWLGFDLILSQTSIQFAMQSCRYLPKLSQFIIQQLKHSLNQLHRFNIVHFDIKPNHFMFSPTFNKIIYIDFGLSQIVQEVLGERSLISFRGTLQYSSIEMKKIFQTRSKNYIDAYYNDAHCLIQSINFIQLCKQKIETENMQTQLFQQQICSSKIINLNHHQIILMNIKSFIFNRKLKKLKKIFDNMSQVIQSNYIIHILSFLSEVYPSTEIKQFYQIIKSPQKQGIKFASIKQIYSSNFSHYKIPPTNYYKRTHFKNYYKNILNRQSKDNNLFFQKTAILELLTNQHNNKIDNDLYIQCYLEYINFSNNIHAVNMVDRVKVTHSLLRQFSVKYQQKREVQNLQIIKLAVKYLLQLYLDNIQKMGSKHYISLIVVKQNIISLIEHVFILKMDKKVELLGWLYKLFICSVWNQFDKLQIILQVNHFNYWLGYSLTSDNIAQQTYKYVLKWCKVKSKELQQNSNLSIIRELADEIYSYLTQKTNATISKNQRCSQIPKTLATQLNFQKLQLKIGKKQNHDDFNHLVNNIYKHISSKQKNKTFFFLFQIYQIYLLQYYDANKCKHILNQIQLNLNCQQLFDSMVLKYISNNFDFSSTSNINTVVDIQNIKTFFQIAPSSTVGKHSMILQINLNNIQNMIKYIQDPIISNKLPKQQIQKHQSIISSAIKWIKKYDLTNYRIIHLIRHHSQHYCVTYEFINCFINIKQSCSALLHQKYDLIEELHILQNYLDDHKCSKCKFGLVNIINIKKIDYVIFNKDRKNHNMFSYGLTIEKDVVQAVGQMQTNELGQYKQETKIFQLQYLLQLASFCSLDISFQDKYHGILNLYYYFKQAKQIQKYLQYNYSTYTILKLTLQVLLRVNFNELSIFLSDLSLYVLKHFSQCNFQLLYDSFTFLVFNNQNIAFQQLLIQIQQIMKQRKIDGNIINIIYYYNSLYFLSLYEAMKIIAKMHICFILLPYSKKIYFQAQVYIIMMFFNFNEELIIPPRKLFVLKRRLIKLLRIMQIPIQNKKINLQNKRQAVMCLYSKLQTLRHYYVFPQGFKMDPLYITVKQK